MASPSKKLPISCGVAVAVIAVLIGWFVYANRPRPTDAQVERQFAALSPGVPLADCELWLNARKLSYSFQPVNTGPALSHEQRLDMQYQTGFEYQKRYKWSDISGYILATVPDQGLRMIGCDSGAQEVTLFFDRQKKFLYDRVAWNAGCV